jgi:hypothetical protein
MVPGSEMLKTTLATNQDLPRNATAAFIKKHLRDLIWRAVVRSPLRKSDPPHLAGHPDQYAANRPFSEFSGLIDLGER